MRRVQFADPLVAVPRRREREVQVLVVGVEADEEGVVDDQLAAFVLFAKSVSVEEHGKALAEPTVPVLGGHLLAGRREPGDVECLVAPPDRLPAEELSAPEHRMPGAQRDGLAGELQQVGVLLGESPVHPGQLGVLAVDVVVALLGTPDLVAVRQHRRPLRQEQRRQDVPLLPRAEGVDLGIVGGSLDSAVPRPVVALAVPVVLTVGHVVLLVVGHQVPQRETVVRDDEVDARERPSAGRLVQIRRSGEPGGELAQGGRLAAPVVADGVAVLAVPFGPERREVAHLVTTLADVPGLGDQFHLTDHRVLLHQIEERGQPIDVVQFAGQRGREVETEAVHVHLEDPVPQRIHDELQRVRMTTVEAVAGSGVVHVHLGIAVDEPVVGGVVDAPERHGGSEVVALGGVVVDDVEDDLDAGVVELTHHRLELGHRAGRLVGVRRVLDVRCQESEGVVAPVVSETLIAQDEVLHELVHGHQFDGGDAQLLEVIDDHRMAQPRVRAAQVLGDVGMGRGHALDVRLVDDRLVVRTIGRPVVLPVEVGVDHHRDHGVPE